ncbi:hypothetical protein [Rhodococcus sp. X156]|uniref:hypothetical protein n=1 Tax=Rhodococcus sp. X156 TaxID=2499145 RepID=UPI000FD81B9C|nr:hypothetical protein [Rhodococcus sp. X156]
MSGRRTWLPIGALVFLLVAALVVGGVALLRPAWFTQDEEDDVPVDRAFSASLLDIGETNGIRLSDDTTTSQSFTVPVPVDSRVDDLVLNLRGHTQVAEASTDFLRVLVDGEAVYVDQLEAGEHALDADIDLPESLAEDGSLTVQVRTTGSLDQRFCNITTELGALVVLDPDRTRVRGTLDEPLRTVRDVVAGINHEVTLVLPPGARSREWYETAARLGAFLTQQGRVVSYSAQVPDGGDGEGGRGTPVLLGPPDVLATLDWVAGTDDGSVRVGERADEATLGVVEPAADVVPTFLTTSTVTTADAGSTAPRTVRLERSGAGPVTLDSLGVDTSVQQITDRRSWRIPYSLADLPGGAVPTSFGLAMLIPATTADARWLVEVRLNDELVASSSLSAGRQSAVAPLPASAQRVRNEVVVTLIRDRDLGGCNVRQTSYDVQLLKQSSLALGGTAPASRPCPRSTPAGST